jgi:crotonobetainyl-CoA:carnitine CoA-transferase CaiB-like acyl-CoA transferase
VSGPLDGLRVVDCSSGTAGPRATGFLADYGAEVLWVEPPGGDPWRQRLAIPYSVFNRAKKSVILDVLGDEDDRQRLFDLLATADVFVQSWRPGVAERLGLGADQLRQRLPRLVCCSISGFGLDGELRDTPGFEAVVQAVAGTMGDQVGFRDGPIFPGIPLGSIGGAYLAVIGTLAAVYRRGIDGIGRHVETSLLDGAIAYLSEHWGDYEAGNVAHVAGTKRIVARSVLCSDGDYLALHTGARGGFDRLMGVIGFTEQIPPNPDGSDWGQPLTAEQHALLDIDLLDMFAREPRPVWLQRLLDADICVMPALEPGEVFDEPQVRHNGMSVEVDDAVLGRVEQVAPSVRFAATPYRTPTGAPTPGQHTDEVLGVLLATTPAAADRAAPVAADGPLLDGVKIVDFGLFIAGPYASRLLAELGAEVIKVEQPAGDLLRPRDREFAFAQAGKRAIAADLKSPEGQEIARRLAEWADVVHHNNRPGVAERLGLGYETVRGIQPEVIYLASPGWGSTGPDAKRQSFAPLMSSYVGASFEVSGQYNPPMFPIGEEDAGNGLAGAAGILMALVHRQRTGEGQYLESPQLNAAMAHMAHVVRAEDGSVLGAGALDPLQLGTGALNRLYRTLDGWICLTAPQDDALARLGKLLDINLLERFEESTRHSVRSQDDDDLLAEVLAHAFDLRRTADVVRDLRDAGIACAEPRLANQLPFLRDPDNQATGRVVEYQHATKGVVREVGRLIRSDHAIFQPHRPVPLKGEHTDEILELIGYDAASIAELRDRRVVL